MTKDLFGEKRSLKPVFFIIALFVLAVTGIAVFYAGAPPIIKIEPEMSTIGRRTPVKVEAAEPKRGLVRVRVELIQDGNIAVLEEKNYKPASQIPFFGNKTEKDTMAVVAGLEALPELKGGNATIRVTAGRAGTWLRNPPDVVEELTLPVRLTPPSLQVTSAQTYVTQGGSEAVTYRVGESAVRDGVRAGDRWFSGYPLPGGGPNDRFALFAVPYDMPAPDVRLVAEDSAGNVAETGFIDNFTRRPLRTDTIQVSDAFLNKVVPPILSQTPEIREQGTLLDSYLMINRELRESNAKTINSLAENSRQSFLWNKPFLLMPNTKVMASFAERRSYVYQGREIDQQDHLGLDLAQTRQAPIPAANDGVVVLARFLGIYGNAVVIDHGYSLMTIYGHLSSIAVTEGQTVARGDIIGKTGETGLAGGDHLHYCTLLAGLPVNPLEWSDGNWIKNRIAGKLGSAFSFNP
ncbi:MAG: M23 family metallopeptidase [Acidobacteriota bacterium]|jgi:murein DD-endopeptidase MepM/ murein hydrolase activator NlpD|nr:M23 family metallopeptidase [Acidobacteriota bacterium]